MIPLDLIFWWAGVLAIGLCCLVGMAFFVTLATTMLTNGARNGKVFVEYLYWRARRRG